MTNDRIIDKIKKCLALAQSSNPNEAAVAMNQAQKLMQLHGITMKHVDRSSIGSAHVQSYSVSKIKDWELRLMTMIAGAFGCKIMWLRGFSGVAFGRYELIGLKSQIEIAQYTCEVMQRKLLKARGEYVNSLYTSRGAKTKAADAFCHGWVTAVSKTVSKFANPEGVDELINETLQDMTNGNKADVQERKGDRASLMAGLAAGAGESIHRPMNTREEQLKLK